MPSVSRLSILSAVIAFIICGVAGFLAGRRLRRRPAWQYWAANAAGLIVGIGVIAAGLTAETDVAWMAGLGVITGWLTGLKYGLAVVVGQLRGKKRARG